LEKVASYAHNEAIHYENFLKRGLDPHYANNDNIASWTMGVWLFGLKNITYVEIKVLLW